MARLTGHDRDAVAALEQLGASLDGSASSLRKLHNYDYTQNQDAASAVALTATNLPERIDSIGSSAAEIRRFLTGDDHAQPMPQDGSGSLNGDGDGGATRLSRCIPQFHAHLETCVMSCWAVVGRVNDGIAILGHGDDGDDESDSDVASSAASIEDEKAAQRVSFETPNDPFEGIGPVVELLGESLKVLLKVSKL